MSNSNRYFGSEEAEHAFNSGYDSKVVEIKEMGWEAARNKLNAEVPPGQKVPMSSLGRWFFTGEADALMAYMRR